jgi:hypothetical protein
MDWPLRSRTQFAQDHFADAELGDRRRSKRLVTLAQQLLTRPCGTLPNKLPDPYQLDAAYRFFRTTDVTPDAIQQPHRRPLVTPRQPRGRERGVPLPVVAIRVWEVDPAAGVEPLEWLLVTNVAGLDVTGVWERVDWYAKRWTVEEYHKGLKTGLGLEELQLTTSTGLQNAIALLSVVSVGLVMLRELARDSTVSEQPIADWVPASWVSVLTRWRQGTGGQLTTVRQWTWALTRLGGHQNAQHLGSPGWLTLLRGWTRLQAMIDGWELHNNCGGS